MSYLTGPDPDALAIGESTVSRSIAQNTGVSLVSSGTLVLTFFTARKTETINNVRLVGGGTAAAATPTLVRAGIWSLNNDGSLTLTAATANDTSVFAAANSAYTRALTSPLAKIADRRYAFGLLVVSATTMPTVTGLFASQATEAGIAPRLGGVLTGQTDLPASITSASISDNSRRLYAVLTP